MKSLNEAEAVVVGGGLAGLTAALFLARAEKTVLLLEKAEKLGGRAQTTNKNGALLNFGPHALFNKGAAIRILTELGCEPTGGSPANKIIGIRQGKLVKLPTDFSSLLTSGAFSLGEKMEFIRIMSKLPKISTAEWAGISLQEWIGKHIRHKRVRDYFYSLFRLWTYGSTPEEQSAAYALEQGKLALQGVLYVAGGWQSIVDHLHAKALQLGVRIQTSCKVEHIVHHDGKIQAVRLSNGESVNARVIIIAAGPEVACKLVEGADRMSLGQWKREAVPLYGACIDLTLKRVPYPKREFAIGVDEQVYFANHSAVIPLTRNGEEVLHIMKYKGSNPNSDPREDERMLTRMLNLLQPGWDREVMHIRYLPNMLVSYDSRCVDKQGSAAAPVSSVKEIRGLFVAGDWVGSEGRLAETAIASAKEAAVEAAQLLKA